MIQGFSRSHTIPIFLLVLYYVYVLVFLCSQYFPYMYQETLIYYFTGLDLVFHFQGIPSLLTRY